jgi:hypothetical protein
MFKPLSVSRKPFEPSDRSTHPRPSQRSLNAARSPKAAMSIATIAWPVFVALVSS